MNPDNINFDKLRNHAIGTVESVSPKEIKILLDINSPQNTAINTGEPTLFPKINGYVLIPCESGALTCVITWIGIEQSSYTKRKGFKDFDLIDLPFPLRKMYVNPLGLLKKKGNDYELKRGVHNYPCVGDSVIIPSSAQLKSIIHNKDEKAQIKIGHSPLAANAPVFVAPDKLFGRHLAVLGNTGSGKSCSVAGLIRWSIEAAQSEIQKKADNEKKDTANARFIILDPNGEYSDTFSDMTKKVRKFRVNMYDEECDTDQLRVPVWMWNSYEWSSISQATGRTQRPLLRQALRELRNGDYSENTNEELELKRYLISVLINLKGKLRSGAASYSDFPGKQNTGEFLAAVHRSIEVFTNIVPEEKQQSIQEIQNVINQILDRRRPNQGGYYPAFDHPDLQGIVDIIYAQKDVFGDLKEYCGPDEDSPSYFNGKDLPNHLNVLAQENNVQQFLDFFIMRIRSILSDTRMSSIIGTTKDITLIDWLENYIGKNNAENGEIAIIDLSLVPSDILHIVISVISRIIFEALQRYKRKNRAILPTTLVIEEAHNFISKYNPDSEDLSTSRLCTQVFEKIAKEGRKFGLGLVLSSQRPSELSSTVLSQCNTFLLHRLVNDKDQDMVKKLVPDNLGSMLDELPVLPTRRAILLGWATAIPILVDIKELPEGHRPDSKDPDFWDVWTGNEKREINWKEIADEWQNEGTETEDGE